MKNNFCIYIITCFFFISSLFSNINDYHVFVACEGNFYENEGSLWSISNGEVSPYENNPIGSVAQSILAYNNQLFVIVNVSGELQIFDIIDDNIVLSKIINTNSSGPREMAVYNNYLYFTNWYSMDVKKLNLITWEIESSILMPGLPEDIVVLNDMLYTSITMNADWSDGNLIVQINPDLDMITESYEVGVGPGDLLVHDNEIYISRTYYDENWNSFYGTSKISASGEVINVNYGAGIACGGSLHLYQNNVFRTFNGGIAQLDENLFIIEDTRIGNYDHLSIYSVEVIDEYIYFGLTDYNAPDDIKVVNAQGFEVASYIIDGSLPGDFAYVFKNDDCLSSPGDINEDNQVNIYDIISIVQYILGNIDLSSDCSFSIADYNSDGLINILDCLEMVSFILDSK